ncbi:MAG TPA: hypothetical protein VN703_06645 [Candidatus Sulfopaludibacter sp.]|nr:hypothetical protein [Candidatus Sulfopaludibacter sp.]
MQWSNNKELYQFDGSINLIYRFKINIRETVKHLHKLSVMDYFYFFLGLSFRNAAKALSFFFAYNEDKPPRFHFEFDSKVQTKEIKEEYRWIRHL